MLTLFISPPCFFFLGGLQYPWGAEGGKGKVSLSVRSQLSMCSELMGKMGSCQGGRMWVSHQLGRPEPSPSGAHSMPINAPDQNMKNVYSFGQLRHVPSCNRGAPFCCLHLYFMVLCYSGSHRIPGLHLCQDVDGGRPFSTWAPGGSCIMNGEQGRLQDMGFLSGVHIELRLQKNLDRATIALFLLDPFLQGLFPKTTGDFSLRAAKRRWAGK